MRKNLRNPGIDTIGNIPWGTHFCQFYQTKEDLIDILIPYFKAGLENNEFCLWITSQPLEVEEAVEALREAVPDADVYLEKRQIEIISYTCLHLTGSIYDSERVINGWIEKLNHALESGYEGLRLSGNTSWLETKAWGHFVNYMGNLDDIIRKYRMIALGSYFIDKHSIAEITEIVSNHKFSLIIREGKWERIDNFGRKKAEEATAQAAEDWEQTFDAMPDLIAIFDNKHRIIRANKAMAAKLGMTPEECVGLACCCVIHGTSKPPLFCPHRQLLKDGAEHTAEVCEDRLGDYFIVSASPLYDSEGKLIGSVHVARDINERKREEHRIRRYNRILEGINRIFGNVVHAKTEEELGKTCLSVALEVTGSSIGFIGEVGADGLLNDIAINDKGRDQCLMYDKTGHRLYPDNFVVRGLHDRAIKSGKSFFTNNPPFHPDSVGVPPGHPSLTSFLGVPLIQNGKTVGVLVVANREGGYSCEQKEDLEAIAPAVTQALKRKKAEQERNQAEEALRESEERFRKLAENSPDVIARFDRQNRHLYVNPAAAEVYGLSQEEIVGKTHSELGRNPEQVKFWEKYNDKVFTTGKIETLEFQYISPQGKKYYFNTRAVPEFFDGKIISVLAISRDITDIKKAEARLKETLDSLEEKVKERTTELEKAYRSLREGEKSLAEAQKMAHIGSWDWNIVTNKIYRSAEIYRIFGLNPQKFGTPSGALLGFVHLEDRDYVNSAIKKAFDGKLPIIDFRIIRPDGEERIVHSESEVIFDERNNPVRMRGTIQDVTEYKKAEEKLRESEEKYRNIVETSNEGIYLVNDEAKITYANKIMETSGYTLEEIIGRPIWDFISEESKPVAKKNFEQRLHSVNKSCELKLIRKDGSYIWGFISAKPFFDKDGKFTGYLGMLTDITERKEAEEALANIETARKKEIHHRIKNNLQVISSLLDLQAEQFKGREDIKDSEVIEAFRESQDRVISMALIHEELYKGGGFEMLNFSPYIRELAESLFQTYKLGNSNISLKIDLEKNLLFDMDIAVPLGMIINELVSNSLKHAFIGRDKGEIQVRLRREELPREEKGECMENREHVNIRKERKNEGCKITNYTMIVSDNGVGVPENLNIEDLDSLGMQLVTSLVEQLDGELELKRDNGTEFDVRFTITEKDE